VTCFARASEFDSLVDALPASTARFFAFMFLFSPLTLGLALDEMLTGNNIVRKSWIGCSQVVGSYVGSDRPSLSMRVSRKRFAETE
jgi:hypothetical protein